MILARLDRWLLDAFRSDATSLGLARVLTGAVLLVSTFPRWSWVADLPEAAYHPPIGLALFVGTPPPPMFYTALSVAGIAAAALLMLGVWTRTASLAVAATLLAGNSFAYAFGKIDHDILLALVPLAGLAAGWDQALRWRAADTGTCSTGTRGWPLAVFALVIALAMGRSGFDKATTGWLDPSRAAVRTHLLWQSIPTGRLTTTASLALDHLPPAAWELADMGAVALELGFLVAVWRRRWWWSACAAACLFHLANSVLFGIQFIWNPVAYGLFAAWSSIPAGQRLSAWWTDARTARVVTVLACAAAGVWRAGVIGGPVPATAPQAWAADVVLLVVAATVGAGYLSRWRPGSSSRTPA